MLHPGQSARRPPETRATTPPAGDPHPSQGPEGRLAPVRAELLPPLSAGRPLPRADRHLDLPRRLPLHRPRKTPVSRRAWPNATLPLSDCAVGSVARCYQPCAGEGIRRSREREAGAYRKPPSQPEPLAEPELGHPAGPTCRLSRLQPPQAVLGRRRGADGGSVRPLGIHQVGHRMASGRTSASAPGGQPQVPLAVGQQQVQQQPVRPSLPRQPLLQRRPSQRLRLLALGALGASAAA